ncbi:Hypothetical protein Tpal_686 [Trichococcus palustris]|jgi:dihydroorotate dehydrogenase electron transfer subunit|uniref:Dihydroorotate dehydrogenase B (NAD(+)), electron transfer subunit n=1 Tax=Trichococcus palustris TaxID=140314 RepID=A0A143YD94_9LACT|nr:dihydroorotate dehydrogenase electron transfer subunit [Trichococcus palustris]CZQ85814.1 Hypothetical protein Tpal_686 [Trichococcus palustris]SFK56944.1 dihydroorotate dehydrogenase electron transfer subunit [Trichococcus palustris]
MSQAIMKVVKQVEIAKDIYELRLKGDLVKEMGAPDQFLHIRVPGNDLLLRRPISIAEIDAENEECVIIYRTEGDGTKIISQLTEGDTLDVLGPLGNGYPIDMLKAGDNALLVGGGIGVPPLYELSKQLHAKGVNVVHCFGFKNKDEVFYEKEFSAFGKVNIATDDGSYAKKGFVTQYFDELDGFVPDAVFACGPKGLLAAASRAFDPSITYLSMEERMACGIGACYGCVCEKKNSTSASDNYRVCVDGPVFRAEEIVL